MPSARTVPAGAARLLRIPAAALVLATATLGLSVGVAAPAHADGDPLAGQTVTGRLVQAYPESAGTQAPARAPLTWVQPTSGDPVRVDTADVGDITPGSTVRLTVGRTVDDGAAGSVGTAHAVTDSEVLQNPTDDASTGANSGAGLTDRVTVVLVEAGGGAPDGTTAKELADAVDGPVRDFWSEQTDGAVRLGVVDTHGWVATTAGCATPTTLWDQAAAAAGFAPGPGNHLLVYVSGRSASAADCSYGMAEVGSGLGSGGRLYVRDTLPSLIAHELGHNFGLGHSSGRQCDGTVDTGSCETAGYRDYYDVMGASWQQLGTLNAAQEARLGVLPAGQRRTFDANGAGGTVTLAPLSGRSGTRALELSAPDGTDYWVEYRAATGQDAWLDTADNQYGLQAGVLVHRSGPLPDTSLLLDGTPSPRAGWADDLQDALPVGAPVGLADGFTVTVQSLTATAATVSVTTTPAAAGAGSVAPPPSIPQPRALPAHGCSGAACRPSEAQPSAAQSSEVQPPETVTAATGAPVAAPVRPVSVALAASTSPSFVVVLAALGAAVLLGGTLLVRTRARRRD